MPPIICASHRGVSALRRETEDNNQTPLIEESVGRFAYDSSAWTRANSIVCYLTEQYRQDDKNYLAVLSAIRRNVFNDDHLNSIKARKIKIRVAPERAPKLFRIISMWTELIMKCSPNFPASRGRLKCFRRGQLLVASLKKNCLSPETLELKIGGAVMFTKNNLKEGFVNGTLGAVDGFDKNGGQPIIKTRNGRRIKVLPMEWKMEENGKIRARITQLPLRLAWAITVIKSQGMSLDEAVMDLSDVLNSDRVMWRFRAFGGFPDCIFSVGTSARFKWIRKFLLKTNLSGRHQATPKQCLGALDYLLAIT